MKKEEYINHVKNNELRNREPDIYDIEEAFEAGYYHAVNMTAEWMKEEVDVYDNEDNRLLQADMEEFVMNYTMNNNGQQTIGYSKGLNRKRNDGGEIKGICYKQRRKNNVTTLKTSQKNI